MRQRGLSLEEKEEDEADVLPMQGGRGERRYLENG